jgi:hypothetical protein
LILEDKGTTAVIRKRKKPLETHRIDINRDQLAWYCNQVELSTEVPVYYVLPQPPWFGDPTGSDVVPNQAICRVDSIAGSFAEWAFISRSGDLRAELGGRGSIYTDQLPFSGTQTLAEFFRRAKECEIGKGISGSGEPSSRIAKAPEEADQEPERVVDRTYNPDRLQYVSSALAVFLPAEDLPAWDR